MNAINSTNTVLNSPIFNGTEPDSQGILNSQGISKLSDPEYFLLFIRRLISQIIGTIFALILIYLLLSVIFNYVTDPSTTFNESFILLIGFLFIISGLIIAKKRESSKIIEYRFVPRTFREEQENPVKVSDLFHDMFNKPTPWVLTYGENDTNFINRRYISQI